MPSTAEREKLAALVNSDNLRKSPRRTILLPELPKRPARNIPDEDEESEDGEDASNTELYPTTVRNQFRAEVEVEKQRLAAVAAAGKGKKPTDAVLETAAKKYVTKEWITQNIWDANWARDKLGPKGRWKHETPLEDESRLVRDYREPAKETKEERSARLKFEIKKQEHDASRPWHRFNYMVSREADAQRLALPETVDHRLETHYQVLYRSAMGNVRWFWQERGIWSTDWSVVPGWQWAHEDVGLRRTAGPWSDSSSEEEHQSEGWEHFIPWPTQQTKASSKTKAVGSTSREELETLKSDKKRASGTKRRLSFPPEQECEPKEESESESQAPPPKRRSTRATAATKNKEPVKAKTKAAVKPRAAGKK